VISISREQELKNLKKKDGFENFSFVSVLSKLLFSKVKTLLSNKNSHHKVKISFGGMFCKTFYGRN
jgi:hypothetical protein